MSCRIAPMIHLHGRRNSFLRRRHGLRYAVSIQNVRRDSKEPGNFAAFFGKTRYQWDFLSVNCSSLHHKFLYFAKFCNSFMSFSGSPLRPPRSAHLPATHFSRSSLKETKKPIRDGQFFVGYGIVWTRWHRCVPGILHANIDNGAGFG